MMYPAPIRRTFGTDAPIRIWPHILGVFVAGHLFAACYNYDIPNLITDTIDSEARDSVSDSNTALPQDTSSATELDTQERVTDSNDTDSDRDSATTSDDTGGSEDSDSDSATTSDDEPVLLPIDNSPLCSGFNHNCALKAGDALVCWGENSFGQIGDNGLTARTMPVPVILGAPLTSVSAVFCGYNHTCALSDAGGVYCWGRDHCGQVGSSAIGHGPSCDDEMPKHRSPVPVQALSSNVASIAAGGGHTCALLNTGQVQCWGKDLDGQLGNDTDNTNQPTPTPVFGLNNRVTAIAAGNKHSCAIQDAALRCWGDNMYGQLGDGTDSNDRRTPVPANGHDSDVVRIAAGFSHTCLLTSSQEVRCFGSNDYGQLGDQQGQGGTHSSTSQPVFGLGPSSGVVDIFAGAYHSCALKSDGELLCWGRNNSGQLGNSESGVGVDRDEPVSIFAADSNIIDLGGGDRHTCAMFTGGGAQCWGTESLGSLGNGDDFNGTQSSPADVLNLP